ncbi:MAG: hypothetical protein F4Y47_17460 [Acidobacteriia bacterium]|nr:hypothetical protein [Terriglobia bacterium]MYK10865.1 hypothetical protein [Terriglobia bacterium]
MRSAVEPDKWHERTAFEAPPDADGVPGFGSEGRSSAQADGIFNWGIGLQTDLYPTEGAEVQFLYEVFNLTNRPSASVPNRNVRLPAGGTNTPPRQMQFGPRIVS